MKEVLRRPIKKVPTLRGKAVVNLFFEASTRTRTSFETAAKILSADAFNWTSSTSSVTKGETLLDTARNIEAMHPDVLVIRHPAGGAAAARGESRRLRGGQRQATALTSTRARACSISSRSPSTSAA